MFVRHFAAADQRMGNTDRRGPEISDGWQGTSDDGSGVDMSGGGPLKVAVIGAGVAGLGMILENFLIGFLL